MKGLFSSGGGSSVVAPTSARHCPGQLTPSRAKVTRCLRKSPDDVCGGRTGDRAVSLQSTGVARVNAGASALLSRGAARDAERASGGLTLLRHQTPQCAK